MRLVRLLALRQLRLHPMRAALSVLAVAAGSAMAVSVFVVRSSAHTSVTEFATTLSGPTELRVVGAVRRGGIEPSVLDAVEATEGVAAAVPIVQGVSLLEGPDDRSAGAGAGQLVDEGTDGGSGRGTDDDETVTVLGVDCRAEMLLGPWGCTSDAVTDHGDRALAVGPGVDTDRGVRTPGAGVPLAGAPVVDALGDLAEGRVVVFGLDTAQRLFDRGARFDVIYVQPVDGADLAGLRARLADAVGEHNTVLDARQGPPEVATALEDALPMFTLLAVFALGIGSMLVHNAAALSIEERRRDLAIVSALGGTSRTVAQATIGEAALVGVAGGVVGAAGGLVVAGPIVASLSAYTERVAGVPLAVHLTWPGVAMAVALGAVVSVTAAAFPVRRALRAEVVAELSQREGRAEGSSPALARRAALWASATVGGLLVVGLGTREGGIEPWQVPAGALGFGLAALTLLMVGAQLAPLALRPLSRLVGGTAAGRLAVANLAREPRRTGTMVVAVGTATVTAFVTAGYINGAREGITSSVVDNLDGIEVSVVGEGANANLETGMSPELTAVLDDVPGAAPVTRRGAYVLVGAEPGETIAVLAYQDPWLDDTPVRGTIDRERFLRGEAVINTALARDSGLRPGDVLRLPAPAGVVEVPVQAIVTGGGATNRAVQVPFDLFTRHYPLPPARSVVVEPAPGTTLAELERSVRDAVEAEGLPDAEIRVLSPRAVAAEASDGVARRLAPFWTLQRALLVVSFVAVLSTLLLVGIQRRRELALLGAVGMEPGMLGRMVLAEAGVVAVLGVAVSATGGLVMLWAINRVAPLLIGFTAPLAPDWWSLVVWGAVSLVVTLLAAGWPAARAARVEVVAGLQDE